MTRIEEIKARLDAATEGPWISHEIDGHLSSPSIEKAKGGILARMTHYHPMREDAAFIAHARADVPYLLAVIESQAKEIEALREANGHLCTRDFAKADGYTLVANAHAHERKQADAIAKARQELE